MKTPNKKKNIFLRIASGMAVAALLSTCVVSTTFAKYTTSTKAEDSARVAYWGFKNASTTTFELFNSKYTNIKSYNETDKVIAPGSSGSADFAFAYTTYSVSGVSGTTTKIEAPEVDYEFTVGATATVPDALNNKDNFIWSLTTITTTETGNTSSKAEYKNVNDLLSAIKALSGNASGTQTYEAGNLPTLASKTYTIGWEWKFDDDTSTGKYDSTDTALGNADNLENITITITITATQIHNEA